MSQIPSAAAIDCCALAAGEAAAAATPLARAAPGDRVKLALLLEGAALLAHLERAGWALAAGWDRTGIDERGRLCVGGTRPGRPAKLPQQQLAELLARLFGDAPSIAGRGQGRKAARRLLAAWSQELTAESPDRAVERVLEVAPFLWGARYAEHRKSLAAGISWEGRSRLSIAGPRGFRRRLAARGGLDEVRSRLAASDARRLWAPVDGDPLELAARGRCSAALELWRRAPRRGERFAFARLLAAQGRFEDALELLARSRRPAALIERGWCQLHAGKPRAAQRTLSRLEHAALAPAELLDACGLGVRLGANLGDSEGAARWVERARRVGEAQSEHAPRAELLAAFAAWDSGRPEAMESHLEASAVLADDPRRAWRWFQAHALAAQAAGDGAEMVRWLTRALGEHRRRLTRFDAGALWNDLGVGRAQLGDLAGAERAFLHAQRLLGRCQGPRRTTLTLYNLAEIRLRRGRLRGVRGILERSTAANRRAGNLRGGVQDAELWARYELVQGRFAAAAGHLRAALAALDEKEVDWRRAALEMLLARSLGLAGRSAAAAEAMARGGGEAADELEPEERPALWAHAGLREEALARAGEADGGETAPPARDGGPLAALWRAALTGAATASLDWGALEALGEFRGARLALDLELVAPGFVPPRLRRRAAETLRELGAADPARRLESLDAGPWEALAAYQRRAAVTPPDGAAFAELLAAAGYPEAGLEWRPQPWGEPLRVVEPAPAGSRSRRTQTASSEAASADTAAAETGAAEAVCAEAELDGGVLVLEARRRDPVLDALFVVIARDYRPAGRTRRASSRGGIVGDSEALRQALDRLERLAPSEVPVLVVGESGTGKELAARRVHELSARAAGPFVALNCAALAETLVLSDLFGHARGAFTGADRDRSGVFESARGGTVFLDEIGDLPLAAQGMLLRVLQEGEVRRLGESLPRKVDVRVVAATHHDLERRVAEGAFRKDLFYRLRVALVELPPLAARGRDVLLLAEHFLARGGHDAGLTAAARARLLGHVWPGNVRELENVLSVATALAGDEPVGEQHLDLPAAAAAPATDYHQSLEAFRRRLVSEALEASGGNRAAAARRLGLSRQALSYLVRQLSLDA